MAVEHSSPLVHEPRDRAQHDRPDGDLADEVAVADVEVEDACAGVEQALQLLAEAGEVRGVDRRLDDARLSPLRPSHPLTVPLWPRTTKSASPAEAAAELVEAGMAVGLGTGTTVGYFLPALAARGLAIRCVATSPATEHAARELGLEVEPFDALDRLDLAVDGADQVTPDGWLVKGGGAALTREKIVAAAADRFVVIVSSDKLVERLAPPVPLELHAFGLQATLRELGDTTLRDVPPTPDGGLIADYGGDVGDPGRPGRPPRCRAWRRLPWALSARARLRSCSSAGRPSRRDECLGSVYDGAPTALLVDRQRRRDLGRVDLRRRDRLLGGLLGPHRHGPRVRPRELPRQADREAPGAAADRDHVRASSSSSSTCFMLYITSWIVSGFEIGSFMSGIWATVIITVVNWVLTSVFDLDERRGR